MKEDCTLTELALNIGKLVLKISEKSDEIKKMQIE